MADSKRRLPEWVRVPWGLLVVLVVYGLAVLYYVDRTYWSTPQYQGAKHYARALYLLGDSDGRRCTQAQLEEAMDHVLEAGRLLPNVRALAEHSEQLRWRFEERKFKLRSDLKHKAEAVSAMARQVEKDRETILVVGARDKGWAADQVLKGPSQVVWIALPGGVLIIALWGWGQFNGKRRKEREHEEELKRQEAHVDELGHFRRGLEHQKVESKARQAVDRMEAQEARKSGTRPRPPTEAGARKVKRRPPSDE